jgi:hypothetical protein
MSDDVPFAIPRSELCVIAGEQRERPRTSDSFAPHPKPVPVSEIARRARSTIRVARFVGMKRFG